MVNAQLPKWNNLSFFFIIIVAIIILYFISIIIIIIIIIIILHYFSFIFFIFLSFFLFHFYFIFILFFHCFCSSIVFSITSQLTMCMLLVTVIFCQYGFVIYNAIEKSSTLEFHFVARNFWSHQACSTKISLLNRKV